MKARIGLALAGCLIVWTGVLPVWATEVTDILRFRPRQPGVVVSTPTPEEQARCKLEAIELPNKGSAWILRDAEGRVLRRFADTNGDRQIDIWSYYRNGVEVYREIDTNFDKKPDQYRWLNAGGMKWGMDPTEDGKIKSWRMISVEEVGQELVQALATHDFARLQALMVTDEDIKFLELPAAEATRIRELRAKAQSKFQETYGKLKDFNEKTRLLHMETEPPQCLPADQTGMKYDTLKHQNVAMICESNGKTDWVQAGEMIQVGLAWRLLDAPLEGLPSDPGTGAAAVDKDVQDLLDQLTKIDQGQRSGTNEDNVRYHLSRIAVLEKIVAKTKTPQDREQRIREMADGLSAAAQISQPKDKTAYNKLKAMVDQISKDAPGSNLAAYVTFREMQADYTSKLNEKKTFDEQVQKDWIARLTKFVQTYPKAEDTPEALLQLGLVNEFLGQEVPAKNWYQQLARDFAATPAGIKSVGAMRRFELDGKPMELAGPQLGTGTAFNISALRGKVVVVYYWASWSSQALGDFAKLKILLDENKSNGVELVCVNLDSTPQEAQAFLQRTPAPGIQLFQADGQASGLESPLATQYGIVAPPNTFLIGRDGKVVSHTIQVGNLGEELKKQVK